MSRTQRSLVLFVLFTLLFTVSLFFNQQQSTPPRALAQQAGDIVFWQWATSGPTGYTRGAYDPNQDAAIIVSVFNGQNQVWQYLAGSDAYVQLNLPGQGQPSPFPRDGYEMARHPISGDLLLFGGHRPGTCSYFYTERVREYTSDPYDNRPGSGCEELNDLWRVNPNNGNWTQITPSSGPPPARTHFAMTRVEFAPENPADATRNLILLSGGYQETPAGSFPDQVVLSDTWELRFSSGSYQWVQTRASDLAAQRFSHNLVALPAWPGGPAQALLFRGLRPGEPEENDGSGGMVEIPLRETYEYIPGGGWQSVPMPDGETFGENDSTSGWGYTTAFPFTAYAEGEWRPAVQAIQVVSGGYIGVLYTPSRGWVINNGFSIPLNADTAPLRNRAAIELDRNPSLYAEARQIFDGQSGPVLLIGGQGRSDATTASGVLVYESARPLIMAQPTLNTEVGQILQMPLVFESGPFDRRNYSFEETGYAEVRVNSNTLARLTSSRPQAYGVSNPPLAWRAECLPPIQSWTYNGQGGWQGGVDPFSGATDIPVYSPMTSDGLATSAIDSALTHLATSGVAGSAYLFGGTGSTQAQTGGCDGWTSAGLHSQLWRTSDGLRWEQVPVSGPTPPPRRLATLVQWQQDFLLFGGEDAQGNLLNDTWRFDVAAGTWTQLSPANAPSPRKGGAAVWAKHAGEVWLFGGINIPPDVWHWNGSNWVERLSAQDAAEFWDPTIAEEFYKWPAAVYNPVRQRALVAGNNQYIFFPEDIEGFFTLFQDFPMQWDGSQYQAGRYAHPGVAEEDDEWTLDGALTAARHFGALHWLGSDAQGFIVATSHIFGDALYHLDPGGVNQPTPTPTPTHTPTPTPTTPPEGTATPTPVPGPAGSRDFGEVRIWADNFTVNGGVVTASGNVQMGSVSASNRLIAEGRSPAAGDADARFFRVEGDLQFPENPGPDAKISVANARIVLIQWDLSIGLGSFEVGPACQMTGNFADELPVLGNDSSLKLTINTVEAYVCATQTSRAGLSGDGTINLGFLPDNAATQIDFDFSLQEENLEFVWDGDAKATSQINLAGGDITATLVIDRSGLTAQTATFKLPLYGDSSINLTNLNISPQGSLSLGGAGGVFPLPDLTLGDADGGLFITETVARVEISGADPNKHQLTVDACLEVKIPGSDAVSLSTDACATRLVIRDGQLAQASLPTFTVTVAGLPMTLKSPDLAQFVTATGRAPGHASYAVRELQAAAQSSYRIFSDDVEWTMPTSWGGQQMRLTGVEILTVAPYVRIGGGAATVPINQRFSLGGTGERASAQFIVQSLNLAYQVSSKAFTARLNSEVVLRIGKESRVNAVVIVENGDVRLEATVQRFEAEMGGLSLVMTDVGYMNEAFTAAQAVLTMPGNWPGGSVTINAVRVDEDGLDFEQATIALPDQNFGGVMFLTNMSATVVPQASGFEPRRYRLDVAATVRVVGDTAASTSGVIQFFPDGRISGEINSFSLSLVAMNLNVQDVKFNNNSLQAARIDLQAGPAFSSLDNLQLSANITGLEVSAAGIDIQGGGFAMSFETGGVTVSGQAAFVKENGDWIIDIGATIGTPQLIGTGAVTIALLDGNDFELRRIFVRIEGNVPNPPTFLIEPSTQLYLFAVEGEITLTDARKAFRAAAEARTFPTISGKSLLRVRADLEAQWQPTTYVEFRGQLFLLEIPLAEAFVRLTPRSVWFGAMLGVENEKITFSTRITGAVGLDPDDEFTALLQASVQAAIKKDAILPLLPPCSADVQALLSVGRHQRNSQKQWGALGTGSAEVCDFINLSGWVWIGWSPVSLDAGTGRGEDKYTPVWPTRIQRSNGAVDFTRLTDGQIEDPRRVVARMTEARMADAILAPSSGSFTIGENLLRVTLVEYLPTGSNPASIPTLTIDLPDGSTLSPVPVGTASDENGPARFYEIESPQGGEWTVHVQSGVYVAVAAADALPTVESAQITQSEAPYGFSWSVTDPRPEEGLRLYIQAYNEEGVAVSVGEDLPVSGSLTWEPEFLPNGTYTVELVVDSGIGNVVTPFGTVEWIDTTPPAPPVDLAAQTRPDGSLLLTWQPGDRDTAGYTVAINGSEPFTLGNRLQTSHRKAGYNGGESVSVTVRAVDLNDNLSDPVEVAATFPNLAAPVQNWSPQEGSYVIPGQRTVSIRFARPVTVTAFLLTGPDGDPLAGDFAPALLFDQSEDPLAIGADWTLRGGCGLDAPGTYTAQVEGVTREGEQPVSLTWAWSLYESERRSNYCSHLPTISGEPGRTNIWLPAVLR